MRNEFVMRGKTVSGTTEVLNFGKYKAGYAYRMTEFSLYPSVNIEAQNAELCGTVTAAKTAEPATNPNFNNDGLIATAFLSHTPGHEEITSAISLVNDTFLITQNLILMVQDSGNNPINWQCRFKSVKMSGPEEASTNFKQFSISDA